MQLSITHVITVSVSEAQTGIGKYNTSNLACFTRETPGGGFGSLGYKIYLSPDEVETDFGTNSDTFAMANSVFSQQPNILAGDGYFVVIPFADTTAVTAVQHIAFPTVPASGAWKLRYGAFTTGTLAYNDNATAVQTALRLLTGLASVTVAGDYTDGFDVTFTGVTGAATLLLVTADSLQDSTPVNVTPVVTTTTTGTTLSTETLATAIGRTKGLVQYFGIMAAEITGQTDMLAAAAVVQPLNKIAFFVSSDEGAVAPGGMFDLLRTGGFTQSRGLYYGAPSDPLVMMAAYAGKGLSTDFSGSNTTETMNLKDLISVQPDSSMTETLFALCQAAGADVYASVQGVPKVLCSGENKFFDQVYNLRWFVGGIQVAGFNFLAEVSTKIPQTESGMDGLKGAYRAICEEAVTNQYIAPGTWNSATTFGVQKDFLSNIEQRGYYIYSVPISQQSQTDRADRKAPLVQIAIKEAGALQSSSVIVNVNA